MTRATLPERTETERLILRVRIIMDIDCCDSLIYGLLKSEWEI